MSDLDVTGYVEDVRAMSLRPGDALIVRMQRRITIQAATMLIDTLKEKFPGHEVFILAPEMDLEVLRIEGEA